MAAAAAVVVADSHSIGVGWRQELASEIAARSDISFVEVMAESLNVDTLPASLLALTTPTFVHGVELSLGSAERPSSSRLAHLQDLGTALKAPLISEHIAFTRSATENAGHLLPLQRTRQMLDVFVENYRIAQDQLSVPLALENVASFLEWPHNELTEVDFVNEILERTGAPFLLDVANLYANSINNGFDAWEALNKLNLSNVAYVHVAGGVTGTDGWYHDTHRHSVIDEVWKLLDRLLASRPDLKVMVERDANFTSSVFTHEMDVLASLGQNVNS